MYLKEFKANILRWLEKHSLIGILLLALILRIPQLNGSFWLDEAAQALESTRPLSQQLQIVNDFQPPLYHFVVHFFSYAAISEWWLRMASIFPGIIAVFITFILGKRMSPKVGIASALLLALNQYHVFYSQELRPYSLAAMLGVTSTYALLSWLNNTSKGRYRLLFITTSILGCYTTYTFPFLLLGQGIAVWIVKKRLLIKELFIVMLAVVPLLSLTYQQLLAGLSLKNAIPEWASVVSLPLTKAIAITPIKFLFGRTDLITDTNTVLILGITMVLVAWLTARSLKTSNLSRVIGLISMFTLASAWICSWWVPVIEPKRFLFLLPLMLIIIVGGIGKDKASKAILVLLVILELSLVGKYWIDKDMQREPWREAIAEINQTFINNYAAIFAFNAPFAPWQWYQNIPVKTISFPQVKVYEISEINATLHGIDEYENIILFEYLQDLTDPDRQIDKALIIRGYYEVGFLQYPGIGKVKHFAKNEFFANAL